MQPQVVSWWRGQRAGAEYYGLSDDRAFRRALQTQCFLDVRFDRDTGVYVQDARGLAGPMPAQPTAFALPRGTDSVATELLSGVVSAAIRYYGFRGGSRSGLGRLPQVTLGAVVSGLNARIVCFDAHGVRFR